MDDILNFLKKQNNLDDYPPLKKVVDERLNNNKKIIFNGYNNIIIQSSNNTSNEILNIPIYQNPYQSDNLLNFNHPIQLYQSLQPLPINSIPIQIFSQNQLKRKRNNEENYIRPEIPKRIRIKEKKEKEKIKENNLKALFEVIDNEYEILNNKK